MKATTTAVGTLVVLGIGAAAMALFDHTDVDFTLKMNAGVCMPSNPDPLKAGYQRKVTWTVRNEDCPAQFVALKNFKHPIDGGQYDTPEEVVKPDPVVGGPVATGQVITLDAKVIKFRLWHKLFKYEIWLGDTAANVQPRRDPDIDVWPF